MSSQPSTGDGVDRPHIDDLDPLDREPSQPPAGDGADQAHIDDLDPLDREPSQPPAGDGVDQAHIDDLDPRNVEDRNELHHLLDELRNALVDEDHISDGAQEQFRRLADKCEGSMDIVWAAFPEFTNASERCGASGALQALCDSFPQCHNMETFFTLPNNVALQLQAAAKTYAIRSAFWAFTSLHHKVTAESGFQPPPASEAMDTSSEGAHGKSSEKDSSEKDSSEHDSSEKASSEKESSAEKKSSEKKSSEKSLSEKERDLLDLMRHFMRIAGVSDEYLGALATIPGNPMSAGSSGATGVGLGGRPGGDQSGSRSVNIAKQARAENKTSSETGLLNYGNTCYFNALLQMLCCSPKLKQVLLRMELRLNDSVLDATDFFPLDTGLLRIMLNLQQSDVIASLRHLATYMNSLKKLRHDKKSVFAGYGPGLPKQQDAWEFLSLVMVRNDTCPSLAPALAECFNFEIETQWLCPNCHVLVSPAQGRQVGSVLPLALLPRNDNGTTETMTLTDLLIHHYAMPEIIDEFTCPSCNLPSANVQQSEIIHLQQQSDSQSRDILLQIQRGYQKTERSAIMHKDHRRVTFDPHPFVVTVFGGHNRLFWVRAAIHHIGGTLDSGHWVADVRTDWHEPFYRMNDSTKTKVGLARVTASSLVGVLLSEWYPEKYVLPKISLLRGKRDITEESWKVLRFLRNNGKLDNIVTERDLPSILIDRLSTEIRCLLSEFCARDLSWFNPDRSKDKTGLYSWLPAFGWMAPAVTGGITAETTSAPDLAVSAIQLGYSNSDPQRLELSSSQYGRILRTAIRKVFFRSWSSKPRTSQTPLHELHSILLLVLSADGVRDIMAIVIEAVTRFARGRVANTVDEVIWEIKRRSSRHPLPTTSQPEPNRSSTSGLGAVGVASSSSSSSSSGGRPPKDSAPKHRRSSSDHSDGGDPGNGQGQTRPRAGKAQSNDAGSAAQMSAQQDGQEHQHDREGRGGALDQTDQQHQHPLRISDEEAALMGFELGELRPTSPLSIDLPTALNTHPSRSIDEVMHEAGGRPASSLSVRPRSRSLNIPSHTGSTPDIEIPSSPPLGPALTRNLPPTNIPVVDDAPSSQPAPTSGKLIQHPPTATPSPDVSEATRAEVQAGLQRGGFMSRIRQQKNKVMASKTIETMGKGLHKLKSTTNLRKSFTGGSRDSLESLVPPVPQLPPATEAATRPERPTKTRPGTGQLSALGAVPSPRPPFRITSQGVETDFPPVQLKPQTPAGGRLRGTRSDIGARRRKGSPPPAVPGIGKDAPPFEFTFTAPSPSTPVQYKPPPSNQQAAAERTSAPQPGTQRPSQRRVSQLSTEQTGARPQPTTSAGMEGRLHVPEMTHQRPEQPRTPSRSAIRRTKTPEKTSSDPDWMLNSNHDSEDSDA